MTLQHRLVIPMVGSSYAPGDPDPLADTDLWFTDRRGVYHPFIAQRGTGPNAGPDISADGQRIDPVTGRAEDGQLQIRAIDRRGTISAVACDVNSPLLAEGSPDTLGLDVNAFTTGGWTMRSSVESHPSNVDDAWGPKMSIVGGAPAVSAFALFFWIDQPPYPGDPAYPRTVGPWVRSAWMEKAFNGTEQGGAAWTPGQKVGFRFRVSVSLDTGPGTAFAEVEGADGVHRLSGLSGPNFWTIPVDGSNNQVDGVLYAVVDANGEVIVRLGGENMAPSFNLVARFTDLEVVQCDDVVVGVDAERYITGWLADADARQQLLGLKAYLEESDDGGETWSRVIYVGYVKSIVLAASLTYVITLTDSGRGRRTGKAWRNLDPLVDFAA